VSAYELLSRAERRWFALGPGWGTSRRPAGVFRPVASRLLTFSHWPAPPANKLSRRARRSLVNGRSATTARINRSLLGW
jgi:hypothetical protein